MGPVAFKSLRPIVHRLQTCSVQAVHAVLSPLDHRYNSGLAQCTKVLGDGRLSHLHVQDDFVDGILLTVEQHSDDFASPWFCNRAEDVGRVSSSCHSVNIFLIRNMSREITENAPAGLGQDLASSVGSTQIRWK